VPDHRVPDGQVGDRKPGDRAPHARVPEHGVGALDYVAGHPRRGRERVHRRRASRPGHLP